MIVTVDEDLVEVEDGATVENLISMTCIRSDRAVVEIDREICSREVRPSTTLRQSMYINVVSFVGGGQ